jgi:hypothetical protein
MLSQECFDMHGFIHQEVKKHCAVHKGTARGAESFLVLGVFSGLLTMQSTLRAAPYRPNAVQRRVFKASFKCLAFSYMSPFPIYGCLSFLNI